jgi:hypothetical protein
MYTPVLYDMKSWYTEKAASTGPLVMMAVWMDATSLYCWIESERTKYGVHDEPSEHDDAQSEAWPPPAT